MQIKPTALEIPPGDPFRNDKLGRDKEAELLTNVISTYTQPLVLSIDATWGNGKTTFLKMWKQSLEDKKVPCLFFNAWEHDFSENALVSFIGEIDAGIDTFPLNPEQKKKAKEILCSAKKASAKLLKRAVPIVIKAVTAGALDIDKVFEDAIGNLGSKLAEDSFIEYEESRNTISSFKEKLREFVSKLHEENSKTPNRLVFFVDEMDRCRPPYAIQLLEKIKHFFDIEGIIFVLAIDKTQIENSIKLVYGTDKSSAYLHRFIDLTYRLKDPVKLDYADILFDRLEFSTLWEQRNLRKYYDDTLELFRTFSKSFCLSLREQERVASHLNVIVRSNPRGESYRMELLVILIILRIKNYSLYKSIEGRETSPMQILEMLKETPAGKDFLEKNELGIYLEAVIITSGLTVSEIRKKYEELKKSFPKESMDDLQGNPERLRIKSLANKIEILIRDYRVGQTVDCFFSTFKLAEWAGNFEWD